MTEPTQLKRPAESPYWAAQTLESVLEYIQNHSDVGVGDYLVQGQMAPAIKTAIDLLRWYDWDEEQRRRQSLKGS